MLRTLLLISILSSSLTAEFHASISAISSEVKQRMVEGKTYKKGCPVPLSQLRYLQVIYKDFEGEERLGELIVHHEVSQEIVEIFKQLYKAGYPIREMVPVSHYRGSDWHSIEADNSSAFNCRKVAGTNRWSKHAYGKAIDINPLENPYISRSGKITHQASLKYRRRVHNDETPEDKAVLSHDDEVVKLFKSYGWRWGGDWRTVKDYQHFEK